MYDVSRVTSPANAYATAAYGMNKAIKTFEDSAVRTAGLGNPNIPVDPVKEVAAQITSRTAFEANVKTAKVANQMIGAVLDIKV